METKPRVIRRGPYRWAVLVYSHRDALGGIVLKTASEHRTKRQAYAALSTLTAVR